MSEPRLVVSEDGARGTILAESTPERRPGIVRVKFEGGRIIEVPEGMLELGSDRVYHLRVGLAELEAAADRSGTADTIVVPVVAEELEIGRRTVAVGTVRVNKHVHEREETIDEPLLREEVSVERVPVGRAVDVAPQTREEGETLIVPVIEEVLVVEKRLILKEEVRITRRRVTERNPQRVLLRSEEVEVERIPGALSPASDDHPTPGS